jgi:hypothetical protein
MQSDPTGLLKYIGVVGFLIPIWLFHLVPLLLISGPVWFFGRRRVKWNGWDFAIVVLPFAVWGALMIVHGTGKSLNNLIEGLIIGGVAPLAPIVRVAVGKRMNEKSVALGLLIALCLVAGSLWAFVPPLPE